MLTPSPTSQRPQDRTRRYASCLEAQQPPGGRALSLAFCKRLDFICLLISTSWQTPLYAKVGAASKSQVSEEQSATDIGVLGRKTPEVHGQPRHSLLPNARVTTRQGPSDIRPEKSVDMNHVWISDQK